MTCAFGSRGRAAELLDRAARDIEPGADAGPDQLSMYGTLLQVATYTAAVDGNRSAATELVLSRFNVNRC